jgi:hypothetical protein
MLHHHLVPRALLLTLFVSSVLATAGVASAQTTAFKAEIKGQILAPRGCPDGAVLCGTATIDGFGPAQYRFFLTSFELTSERCGNYTATTTFTLQDGSTLTLDEAGAACGIGPSFFKGGERSYGNPRTREGSWDVQSASGQFAGMTGSGTSAARFVGAHLSATYTGVLQARR